MAIHVKRMYFSMDVPKKDQKISNPVSFPLLWRKYMMLTNIKIVVLLFKKIKKGQLELLLGNSSK